MTLLDESSDRDEYLAQAASAYYKLILIVGRIGSGKSSMLREISGSNFTQLNFGKEFSRELSTKPAHLRAADAEEVAIDIVEATNSARIAIDNTEVLFESPIRLNPLALLKSLSTRRLIIATWNGSFDDSRLYYGIKGHPAYEEIKFTKEDTFIIVPTTITV